LAENELVSNTPKAFKAETLLAFAQEVLVTSGMAPAAASDVARILLEGDLLGHDTHGLQLLAGYAGAVADGTMLGDGQPELIAERSSVLTWNGRRLPGPHLVEQALKWAMPRAREHGTATVAIQRSHHIGCLAAYLEAPARDGLLVSVQCSDPAHGSVAPFGGCDPVFTPNPISWGIPTGGDPIIIDISASITTNGMSGRMAAAGQQGRHAWWLTNQGEPSHDPGVLNTSPPGSILPLGGAEAGHKGYGLALQVEALTAGLAGHGRADPSEGWGATVFVQVFDPAAFAGLQAFERQMNFLVQASHNSRPVDPSRPVRLPGERGLSRKREQLAGGVVLNEGIQQALRQKADELGLSFPAPV